MAAVKRNYVIEFVSDFVSDMDRAVKFYRHTMGLPLTIQSPGWSWRNLRIPKAPM